MKTYKVLNTDFTTSEFQMEDDATVADLKEKFAKTQSGLEPEDFVLKFSQRELKDDFRLGRIMDSKTQNIEVHPKKKKDDVFAKYGL